MNDLVIPAAAIRREVRILGILFTVAFLMNVYAIVIHNGEWIELMTQLHVVAILTGVLYAFGWVMRGLVLAVRAISRRRG